jgi:hypothetical protein
MQILRAACLPTRFPRPLFPSFIALIALALLWWAIGVQAAPNAVPEAPGSIAGVVRDEQGVPLRGINVILLQRSPEGNWRYGGATITINSV